MAYRKVDEASLTAVADAIRTKGGTAETLSFPDGFVSAVEGIQVGGNEWINYIDCVTFTEKASVLLNTRCSDIKIQCGLKITMESRFIWINGWNNTYEQGHPFIDSVGTSDGWKNVVITEDEEGISHVTAELGTTTYTNKLRVGFWDSIFTKPFPLYYCRVYTIDGVLLHDLKPIVLKNGMVGIYDAVDEYFYFGTKIAYFIAGEAV